MMMTKKTIIDNNAPASVNEIQRHGHEGVVPLLLPFPFVEKCELFKTLMHCCTPFHTPAALPRAQLWIDTNTLVSNLTYNIQLFVTSSISPNTPNDDDKLFSSPN